MNQQASSKKQRAMKGAEEDWFEEQGFLSAPEVQHTLQLYQFPSLEQLVQLYIILVVLIILRFSEGHPLTLIKPVFHNMSKNLVLLTIPLEIM